MCVMLISMKTLSTTTSHQLNDSGKLATNLKDDWKRQFRLSVLDLNPLLKTNGDNVAWLSQEPWLQRTLDLVRDEIAELNALMEGTGEQSLSTDSLTLLSMLGMAGQTRPISTAEKLTIAWRMLSGLLKFHHRSAVLRAALRSLPTVSTPT
jgi:hypothetical protein